MGSERKNYWGFNPDKREYARDRANSHCEIGGGGDCDRPITGKVNHITGSFEGRQGGFAKVDIQNVRMNGAVLCGLHEFMHDIQETDNLAGIIKTHTVFERRVRRPRRHHRRR